MLMSTGIDTPYLPLLHTDLAALVSGTHAVLSWLPPPAAAAAPPWTPSRPGKGEEGGGEGGGAGSEQREMGGFTQNNWVLKVGDLHKVSVQVPDLSKFQAILFL